MSLCGPHLEVLTLLDEDEDEVFQPSRVIPVWRTFVTEQAPA